MSDDNEGPVTIVVVVVIIISPVLIWTVCHGGEPTDQRWSRGAAAAAAVERHRTSCRTARTVRQAVYIYIYTRACVRITL